jgi:hypothetical protein
VKQFVADGIVDINADILGDFRACNSCMAAMFYVRSFILWPLLLPILLPILSSGGFAIARESRAMSSNQGRCGRSFLPLGLQMTE